MSDEQSIPVSTVDEWLTEPVDNQVPVFYLVGGYLVFGVPKAVA